MMGLPALHRWCVMQRRMVGERCGEKRGEERMKERGDKLSADCWVGCKAVNKMELRVATCRQPISRCCLKWRSLPNKMGVGGFHFRGLDGLVFYLHPALMISFLRHTGAHASTPATNRNPLPGYRLDLTYLDRSLFTESLFTPSSVPAMAGKCKMNGCLWK